MDDRIKEVKRVEAEEIKVGDMVFYPEAPEVYYKVVGAHNDLLWVVYEKNGHYRTAMKSEVRLADLRGDILRTVKKNNIVHEVGVSSLNREIRLDNFWFELRRHWAGVSPDGPRKLRHLPNMIEDLITLWDDVRPLVVDECAKKTWVPCEKDGGK